MIESFKIKKIYPDTVKIEIFEKIPIAILHDKKKKYFYTNKDEIINFVYINEYKDLPIVIGDKESFQIFIRNLKKIDFPINSIRSSLCKMDPLKPSLLIPLNRFMNRKISI